MRMSSKWPIVTLGEVAEINPTRPRALGQLPDDHIVSFVPMPAVDQYLGSITKAEARRFVEVKKGFTYFAENDVIFAKITPCMQNGKSAIARGLNNGLGFGSTEFHVVRAKEDRIIPEWIWYFVRRLDFRIEGTYQFRGGVGQQRVPADFLAKAHIPLPPLEEQYRIVGRINKFLDRLGEIEYLRINSRNECEAFIRSYYHDLYHDLLQNHPSTLLKDAGEARGGGTPSKSRPEFWLGDIPWISPKEMKRRYISESSSYITAQAIDNSSTRLIERPSVLFVVRGMILAHTFPVAVNLVPVTLNQDMKAITPHEGIDVDFLATILKGAEREMLSRIEVAGHGTRRLQTANWNSIKIPHLSLNEQKQIMDDVKRTEMLADEMCQIVSDDNVAHLRESILRKAFAGEL